MEGELVKLSQGGNLILY